MSSYAGYQLLFANNAGSTFAGPITNTAVSLNLASGGGALFPSPSSGQAFVITAVDSATGLLREIMLCTARSVDTLTVVRGQESTTALNWLAGDLIQQLWTAGQAQGLQGFNNVVNFTATTSWTVPANVYIIRDTKCWGAGGGGGGAGAVTATAGSGGGSGSYSETINTPVTPGQVITVTIGAGGVGGNGSGTNGSNGGTTSFGSTCSAPGGGGGTGSTSGAGLPGGAAGVTGTGSLTLAGNIGGTAIALTANPWVSGAGAGSPFVGSSASGNQGTGGTVGTFPGGGGNGGAATGAAGSGGGTGGSGFCTIQF